MEIWCVSYPPPKIFAGLHVGPNGDFSKLHSAEGVPRLRLSGDNGSARPIGFHQFVHGFSSEVCLSEFLFGGAAIQQRKGLFNHVPSRTRRAGPAPSLKCHRPRDELRPSRGCRTPSKTKRLQRGATEAPLKSVTPKFPLTCTAQKKLH